MVDLFYHCVLWESSVGRLSRGSLRLAQQDLLGLMLSLIMPGGWTCFVSAL